jgi:two-component system, cell cycle response regulator DivK
MSAGNHKGLILIVDDFEANRELNSFILSNAGFQVDCASDGREALDKTFQLQPDLIIMDLSLPDISGWDAVRRLKSDDKTKQIPIIVLTGHSIDGLESAMGCERVLTKPCLPDKIVAEVANVLRNRGNATSRLPGATLRAAQTS